MFVGRQSLGVVFALVAMASIAACSGPTAPPAGTICNGVDEAVGGCDADRPSFSATTCDAVATEAGQQLDRRLAAIYAGPDTVGDESKSVRAAQATSLIVGLANQHLRASGAIASCTGAAFVTMMAAAFSDDVKRQAGTYLYDGQQVTYETFLADLLQVASVIDMER